MAASAFGVLLAYLIVAYLLAPAYWKRYVHKHPSLEDVPDVTFTADGIPADPINVALIGTKPEDIASHIDTPCAS